LQIKLHKYLLLPQLLIPTKFKDILTICCRAALPLVRVALLLPGSAGLWPGTVARP
jgi:hypothetical protein